MCMSSILLCALSPYPVVVCLHTILRNICCHPCHVVMFHVQCLWYAIVAVRNRELLLTSQIQIRRIVGFYAKLDLGYSTMWGVARTPEPH